jgi:hypothetical protein
MGRTLFPVAAIVTVRVVSAEILPEVAVMVVVPAVTAVARPPLLTVATSVFEELQVTCVVMSWLVPSEYLPKAASCRVFPAGILGLAGITDMEVRIAGVTVRIVFPEMVPKVAIMVAVPTATPVARPVLLIDANDVLDELQMTCVVISWLVPSENVPVATNCWVIPTGRLGLTGVKAIETTAGVDPPPPPLPPHPVNSTRVKIIKKFLLDFIDAHSRRD